MSAQVSGLLLKARDNHKLLIPQDAEETREGQGENKYKRGTGREKY